MASFLIYCPCKVGEFGLGVISHGREGKGLAPYLYYDWINEGHERAKCKFCGFTVRRVGQDKSADKMAGITSQMIKDTWGEHDNWMKGGD